MRCSHRVRTLHEMRSDENRWRFCIFVGMYCASLAWRLYCPFRIYLRTYAIQAVFSAGTLICVQGSIVEARELPSVAPTEPTGRHNGGGLALAESSHLLPNGLRVSGTVVIIHACTTACTVNSRTARLARPEDFRSL